MSDVESNRGWRKRVEARIALALARAAAGSSSGSKALAILANHQALTNAAPIGPAVLNSFVSAPFTTTTGKVRITAIANPSNASGATVADGDNLQLEVLRTGSTQDGGKAQLVIATGGASHNHLAYSFDDVAPPGTYTYEFTLLCNNAHTTTLLDGDATILLQEQA